MSTDDIISSLTVFFSFSPDLAVFPLPSVLLLCCRCGEGDLLLLLLRLPASYLSKELLDRPESLLARGERLRSRRWSRFEAVAFAVADIAGVILTSSAGFREGGGFSTALSLTPTDTCSNSTAHKQNNNTYVCWYTNKQ